VSLRYIGLTNVYGTYSPNKRLARSATTKAIKPCHSYELLTNVCESD